MAPWPRWVWHSAEAVAKVQKAERWPSLDFTVGCELVLDGWGALLRLFPFFGLERADLAAGVVDTHRRVITEVVADLHTTAAQLVDARQRLATTHIRATARPAAPRPAFTSRPDVVVVQVAVESGQYRFEASPSMARQAGAGQLVAFAGEDEHLNITKALAAPDYNAHCDGNNA